MAYTRIDWKNGEAGNTPLNANNLNRMDEAIAELDERAGDSEYNFDSLEARVTQAETNLNGKMNKNNPVGNGILTIDAVNTQALTSMDVDTNDLEVSRISGKNGVIIATDDITVDGIPTPIGSLANTANTRSQEAEMRANSAYNRASDAIGDAVIAMNRANENKTKIDLHTGLIGGGVGDKEPILGYGDGYYIAPSGSVTQYNATAKLIMIDFLDFFYSGDNIIFNHVDLLPTENCIPCAWYDISGNFISAADGLNVIAEIDEQTFKITKQYIDYCIIPVPAGASSCKLSGLANGRADIRIQTSLSEAIKELQSKPEPAPLVLTNPSPLPATDGKKILGIDALGKSWQDGTQKFTFTQGAIVPTVGSALNQDINANNSRCTSNIIQLPMGSVISAPSGYEIYLAHATTENGNIDIAQTWVTTYTTAVDGYWRVVCRNKSNTSATITPIECNVIANVSPTPSNPIPITNANPEVTAINGEFEQGTYTSASDGKTFEQIKQDSATRIRLKRPCRSTAGKTIGITVTSGFEAMIKTFNENELFVATSGWARSLTITASNYYAIIIRKANGADIVPAEYSDANISISGADFSNSVSLPFDPESVGSTANEFIIYEDGTGKKIEKIIQHTFTSQGIWNTAADGAKYLDKAQNIIGKRFVTDETKVNLLCSCLSADNMNNTRKGSNKIATQYVAGNDSCRLWVSPDVNVSELVGQTLYLIAETPVETALTPEEVAAVRQLMTYKGKTTIESEMDVKSVTYSGDVKAYVDGFHTYSTVPTICGYEEDGTPIYKVKIKTNTPSSTALTPVYSGFNSNTAELKNIGGCIKGTATAQIPINCYINSTYYAGTWLDASGICMSVASAYTNKPCEIEVEYTLKDSAPAAASVLSLDEETEE